jgi:hypothetical protein
MKTTIKHQTETGKIETRKTEREYTHVVVRRYTVEEGGEARAAILRSIERIEADRAYAKKHADEAKDYNGTLYVTRGYNLYRVDDDAWYDRGIAKERKRLAAVEAMIEQYIVVSWHSTAALAAKAADRMIAKGVTEWRTVKVEEVNGGER